MAGQGLGDGGEGEKRERKECRDGEDTYHPVSCAANVSVFAYDRRIDPVALVPARFIDLPWVSATFLN
jgi:hypothetical protein